MRKAQELDIDSRTQAIVKLIESRPIATQGDLISGLRELGFAVTQATVSRDLRRLGLIKAPHGNGGYRYAVPKQVAGRPPQPISWSSFVVEVAEAEAFCVVKTLPGRAMAVAVAIDDLHFSQISGTLAGDDMVLVMIGSRSDKGFVKRVLKETFQGASQ